MKKLDTEELNKWKELPTVHLHGNHRDILQSKLLDEFEVFKLSDHCKPSTLNIYRMWIVHCCQTLNKDPEELVDLTALKKYQLKIEYNEVEDNNNEKKPQFSEKTIYVGIMAIRSFLIFLRKTGKGDRAELDYILDNLKPKSSPQPNDDSEKLTLEEGYKFLDYINNNVKNVRTRIQLKLMMTAGLRLGEVVGLGIDDVDTNTKTLKLNPTNKGYGAKGQKKHILQLQSLPITVFDDINYYLSNNLRPKSDTKFLLVTSSGKQYKSANVRMDVYRHSIKALPYKKKAVPPHSLRHWFSIRLRADGNDLETIRKLLRHESLKSTQIYFKGADLNADLERVYGKNGSNGPGNNQINLNHVNHVNQNVTDPLEQIEKLGNLMEKGFITEEQYESKKVELLKRV